MNNYTHAPFWNGQKLSRVTSTDTLSYVMSLGFVENRPVVIDGVAIYVIYSRYNREKGGDDEIWVPLLRGSTDYLIQLSVFINDVAMIEGVAQADVYETITWVSKMGMEKDAEQKSNK